MKLFSSILLPLATAVTLNYTAPLFLGGEYAPAAVANSCPGLGTRFLLSYWPNLP